MSSLGLRGAGFRLAFGGFFFFTSPLSHGGQTRASPKLTKIFQTRTLPKILLAWYRKWRPGLSRSGPEADPLLLLAGSGKRLWADEHADEYVRRLRES